MQRWEYRFLIAYRDRSRGQLLARDPESQSTTRQGMLPLARLLGDLGDQRYTVVSATTVGSEGRGPVRIYTLKRPKRGS